MSDQNTSLPVRTEAAGDIVAKIGDGTTPSQQLAIDSSGKITSKLNDGAGNTITSTASALDVNIKSGAIGTADKTAFTYGTTNELPVGGVYQDTSPSLTAGTSGALRLTAQRGLHTNLRDSSGNELLGQKAMASSVPVVISSDQSAIPISNLPTTADTNYGTVGASTIRTAAEIGNATGAANFGAGATGAQTLRAEANQGAAATTANGWPVKPTDGTNSQGYTASSEAKVSVTQPLPTGTNNIGKTSIQDSAGAAFSASNPLFVTLADSVGTSVDNYNTSAALAAAATSNHDYTVTAAKTFYCKGFRATASGKLKVEVQFETAAGSGTFNSFWVGFNSTSSPDIYIPVLSGKNQVAGAKIRIIRTNLDKASQDVYSTTSGTEQ